MITKEQAIDLGNRWGRTVLYHATLRNRDGSAVRARVNGCCKVWKTRPDDWRLPLKHGLRDFLYLTQDNSSDWLLEDPTEKKRQHASNCKRVNLPVETPAAIVRDAMLDKGLVAH